MSRPFDIIATFGPGLAPPGKLEEVSALGATIIRLNGAHIDWARASETLEEVRRRAPKSRILLDLTGRKIRVAKLAQPIKFEAGKPFRLDRTQVNFPQVFEQVKAGDKGSAVDGMIRLTVKKVTKDFLELTADVTGQLTSGKGMHFATALKLPPTSPDEEANMKAVGSMVDYFGLSFVHTADDIAYVRGVLGDKDNRRLLPKIETSQALANRESIATAAESIVLIDRGDLASEIGMGPTVIGVQEIIKTCKKVGRKVIVATHFLRSMGENPVPTMSEYFDLHFVLSLGVDGIQFSDETAVGRHPAECLTLLNQALGRS